MYTVNRSSINNETPLCTQLIVVVLIMRRHYVHS